MTDLSPSRIRSKAAPGQDLQQWIRIIGIGSHHGADQTGWLACERLQAQAGAIALDWQLCRTPAHLPNLMQGCDAVVIIDAVLKPGTAGQVICLAWPIVDVPYDSLCSSHNIPVTEALQLASTLGVLPSQIWLLGITIPRQTINATAVVNQALPHLQQALNQIMAEVASPECAGQ